MLPGNLGVKLVKTQGRSYPPNLVCRDTHSDTGTANQNRPFCLLCGNSYSGKISHVRIVNRTITWGTEIQTFMVKLRNDRLDLFYRFNSTMVTCYCNYHIIISHILFFTARSIMRAHSLYTPIPHPIGSGTSFLPSSRKHFDSA